MNLRHSDLEALLELAIASAQRAGAHIQSKVGRHGKTLSKMAGDTLASQVVTKVDLESESIIVDALRDSLSRYELGLLTEESEDDSSRLKSDYFWCIDPIDGTLPFSEGQPGYSVSIALVSRQGEPLIGVIQDPASSTLYHAMRGAGAWKNNQRISKVNEVPSQRLTWAMDRSMKQLPNFPHIQLKMEELAQQLNLEGLHILDQSGSVLNACSIIEHCPGTYFKFAKPNSGGGSVWDFAATACLAQELDVTASDIFGQPLQLNPVASTFMNAKGVLYASSAELSKSVRSIFQQITEF
ncbi:MAG: inositol monophosphatase family protein [Gimesia sp.]